MEAQQGRFDFNDGGTYIGHWQRGCAHGLGVSTGPNGVGEYSGRWDAGFETCGVYVWPNGNSYAGTWAKGKRHGVGQQIRGRWLYQGQFTDGICGPFGVKTTLNGKSSYEGCWSMNRFEGYGIETCSDGSIYAGSWSKGLRHGLGVRRSYLGARTPTIQLQATDELSVISSVADKSNQPASAARQSTPEIGVSVGDSKCADIMVEARASRKAQIGRSIMKRLRKQYSAIELGYSASPGRMSLACMSPVPSSALGPALCNVGTYTGPKETECSAVAVATANSEGSLKIKPPESLDRSTSAVLEVYAGEWYEDKRSGYGVWICSTGLRYLGEWADNQRHGYGILHYPDGTQDEGQFMANQLSTRVNRKNRIHILRQNKLKDLVELTVVRATAAANEARNISAEQAREKAQLARKIAQDAASVISEAREASEKARVLASQIDPHFHQPGPEWEAKKRIVAPSTLRPLEPKPMDPTVDLVMEMSSGSLSQVDKRQARAVRFGRLWQTKIRKGKLQQLFSVDSSSQSNGHRLSNFFDTFERFAQLSNPSYTGLAIIQPTDKLDFSRNESFDECISEDGTGKQTSGLHRRILKHRSASVSEDLLDDRGGHPMCASRRVSHQNPEECASELTLSQRAIHFKEGSVLQSQKSPDSVGPLTKDDVTETVPKLPSPSRSPEKIHPDYLSVRFFTPEHSGESSSYQKPAEFAVPSESPSSDTLIALNFNQESNWRNVCCSSTKVDPVNRTVYSPITYTARTEDPVCQTTSVTVGNFSKIQAISIESHLSHNPQFVEQQQQTFQNTLSSQLGQHAPKLGSQKKKTQDSGYISSDRSFSLRNSTQSIARHSSVNPFEDRSYRTPSNLTTEPSIRGMQTCNSQRMPDFAEFSPKSTGAPPDPKKPRSVTELESSPLGRSDCKSVTTRRKLAALRTRRCRNYFGNYSSSPHGAEGLSPKAGQTKRSGYSSDLPVSQCNEQTSVHSTPYYAPVAMHQRMIPQMHNISNTYPDEELIFSDGDAVSLGSECSLPTIRSAPLNHTVPSFGIRPSNGQECTAENELIAFQLTKQNALERKTNDTRFTVPSWYACGSPSDLHNMGQLELLNRNKIRVAIPSSPYQQFRTKLSSHIPASAWTSNGACYSLDQNRCQTQPVLVSSLAQQSHYIPHDRYSLFSQTIPTGYQSGEVRDPQNNEVHFFHPQLPVIFRESSDERVLRVPHRAHSVEVTDDWAFCGNPYCPSRRDLYSYSRMSEHLKTKRSHSGQKYYSPVANSSLKNHRPVNPYSIRHPSHQDSGTPVNEQPLKQEPPQRSQEVSDKCPFLTNITVIKAPSVNTVDPNSGENTSHSELGAQSKTSHWSAFTCFEDCMDRSNMSGAHNHTEVKHTRRISWPRQLIQQAPPESKSPSRRNSELSNSSSTIIASSSSPPTPTSQEPSYSRVESLTSHKKRSELREGQVASLTEQSNKRRLEHENHLLAWLQGDQTVLRSFKVWIGQNAAGVAMFLLNLIVLILVVIVSHLNGSSRSRQPEN
ncbi:hypothetical protein P879_01162 [Paragonimus westermani]|uniref:Junctophilin n=1 Tax=Paragonimus westermani TaxID=34504 RepID=A0A8T0DKG2_9TREM|nr:hypothetical protein P879_01162 [Paragonimus westermani]